MADDNSCTKPSSPVSSKYERTFAYSLDGEKWTDVKDRFNARQGKWIGATLGLYAVCEPDTKDRGWIDADYFRVTKECGK